MQACRAAEEEDSVPGGAQKAGSCGQQQCGDGGCNSGGGGGSSSADPPPAAAGVAAAPPAGTICMKCRKQEAQLVARGREPLCHPCLHEQLLGKVRNAMRLHALILPGDTLAVAFSGGLASAALLHFLADLRNPRTDRPARGKVSFRMHIIHIDESAALGLTPEQAAAARASVAAAAERYCVEAGVQYHCVPLEAIFAPHAVSPGASAVAGAAAAAADGESLMQQQAQHLRALLGAVRDGTGRQDLARHLRTQLLLRTAAGLGCGRVARGDCSTTLAAHIVAAAAKGCGYSLPGDVHLVDARYGPGLPSFFMPLREVSSRELALACTHLGLPLAASAAAQLAFAAGGGTSPGSSGSAAAARQSKLNINALAEAFVAGMETHNPGSVPNILNTLSKLHAFPWNEPALAGQAAARQQQQWRQQQGQDGAASDDRQQQREQQRQPAGSILCPICLAPLADDEVPGSNGGGSEHTSGGSGTAAAAAAAGCCLSCCGQILGSNSQAAGCVGTSGVAAALPPAVQQRMAALAAAGPRVVAAGDVGRPSPSSVEHLRAQIADFLLE